MFDLNDFDETLPGPFEYDVKRMAASFTIAARNNGFTDADARSVTMASVAAYREAMAEFAGMPTMDVWHARLSEQDIMSAHRTNFGRARRRAEEGDAARREVHGQGEPTRRALATASRRCRSSRNGSTASTASSTNHRSSSLLARSAR